MEQNKMKHATLAAMCIFVVLTNSGVTSAQEQQNAANDEKQNAMLSSPSNKDDPLMEQANKRKEQQTLERILEKQAAFDAVLDKSFPIKPEQMRQVRETADQMQEAARMPVPSGGSIRSRSVSLMPGSAIQKIHLYPHYVTTIRILDASGAPWPVSAYMVGNENYFHAQRPEMEPHNIVMVAPVVNSGNANLTIVLAAPDGRPQPAPLSFQLVVSPNNKTTLDSVVDIRLDQRGPKALSPAVAGGGDFVTDELLLSILDGVPPREALPVQSSSKEISVWRLGSSYYVRTPEKIVWPAWKRTISSSAGSSGSMHAYELPPVSELLFSGGRNVRLSQYSESTERVLSGK